MLTMVSKDLVTASMAAKELLHKAKEVLHAAKEVLHKEVVHKELVHLRVVIVSQIVSFSLFLAFPFSCFPSLSSFLGFL